jgi:hypothetical protein
VAMKDMTDEQLFERLKVLEEMFHRTDNDVRRMALKGLGQSVVNVLMDRGYGEEKEQKKTSSGKAKKQG